LVYYYQGVEHLMAKLKSPLLSQSQVKTFTIGVKEVNVKSFSYLRTYDRRWYWKLAFGLNLTIVSMMMSSGGLVYYLIFK
jgi:hypothetical protein